MHENGFKLADNQKDVTPMQRYVYLRAKEYHEEEAQESVNENNSIKHGQEAVKGF